MSPPIKTINTATPQKHPFDTHNWFFLFTKDILIKKVLKTSFAL